MIGKKRKKNEEKVTENSGRSICHCLKRKFVCKKDVLLTKENRFLTDFDSLNLQKKTISKFLGDDLKETVILSDCKHKLKKKETVYDPSCAKKHI
jgi:hypothetical protein